MNTHKYSFHNEMKTKKMANSIMDGFFKKVNQKVNLGRQGR